MKRLIFSLMIIGLFLATGTAAYAQRYSDLDTMSVVDNYGQPGDTVGVYLYMGNHTLAVGAYTARIVFNGTILQALNVVCYDRGCALDATSGMSPSDSVLVILAYTFREDYYIPTGSGPVAIMNFRVRPGATPGSSTTLRFVDDDHIPPEAINAWTDTSGSGELVIPQLVAGNFLVTGGGTNQPPVIVNIGPQQIAEGQVLQFNVTAHDPNGDPITLSAQGLPLNATFPTVQGDSVVTGTFTFTPNFEQGPDTYYVDFVAADDHNNTTTRTVQIVVLDQPNDILSIDSGQGGVPGAAGRDVNVTLFNTRPIYGIQFDYLFDPTQISVTDVLPTPRCLDLGFWFNSPEAGRIVVLIFSPGLDPLGMGSGPIVQFITDVNVSADFGRSPATLDSAIEVIDSIATSRALMMEGGYFTVDRFGDANLDENVNVGDCVMIVAYIIERIDLNVRQFDAADINRDSRVNVGDLQAVIDQILEIEPPPGPVPPSVLVVVELIRDMVPAGDILAVPMWADIATEAAAVQFEVTFNPEHVEAVGIESGSLLDGMRFDNNVSAGKINGVFYDLGGSTFGPASGEMANFQFRITSSEFNPARDIKLNEFIIVDPAAGFIPAEIKGQLPEHFVLNQNYPNPFNTSTNISFDLPDDGNIELSIYDIMGRKVSTLLSNFLPAGSHTITWNGRSDTGETMATGVFFYRLRSASFDETKKMLLVK